MSTQDNESAIHFSVLPAEGQRHFRLLELPAELLSLLTSEDPPLLQFKSPEESLDQSSDSSAVLCTADQTFHMRQVNTSNSVFVAKTVTSSLDGNENVPRVRVEAIAQSHFTLEVQLAKNLSAVPYLQAAVPVYTSTGHTGSEKVLSKKNLFCSIPASDGECEQAWIDMACFELQAPQRCYRPSVEVRRKAWETIIQCAISVGLPLAEPVQEGHRTMLARDADDMPPELMYAVMKSVSSKWTDASFQFDGEKCTRLAGLCLLYQMTKQKRGPISKNAFVSAWLEQLPTPWTAFADVKLLEPHLKCENAGQDVFYVESGTNPTVAANGGTQPETKSTLGAKRKWHEKFRAVKKAA